MPAERDALDVSEDAVLGGRLRLRQPLRGHRVGHDAILLAAATHARSGEHAIDLGAGVGAAGLALAARIAGLKVTLVEIDPELCALASENARLNGIAHRVTALIADVADAGALAAAGLVSDSIDRIVMNPPFNDSTRQNVSPDPRRRLAHVSAAGTLTRWIASAAHLLNADGTLTMIWRADGLEQVLAALTPSFGAIAVLPVLPRAGAPAIRILVRAMKRGDAPLASYPGLCLNDEGGRPTVAAEAILRGGETLPIASG
jgi:tRNA1(Val) A37 N6-methylase TrmN6